MKDVDIKSVDIIEQIKSLNEKAYQLFGRLNENRDFLIDETYQKAFAANIYNAYEQQAKLLNLSYEWLYNSEEYKLNVEGGYLTPKRRRRWWFPFIKKSNPAAKIIEDRAKSEFDNIMAARQAELLKAQSDHRPYIYGDEDFEDNEPATDEPQTPNPEELAEQPPDEPQTPATEEPQPIKKKHKRGKKGVQTPAADDNNLIEVPFKGENQLKLNLDDK